MNRNDLRYLKTEEAIRKAFLACVDQRGFEQTRVAHICADARISRNTFYAHYADKHELMRSICVRAEQDMRRSMDDATLEDIATRSFRLPVAWCMEAVDRHRELLRLLIKCSRRETMSILARVFVDEPMRRITPDYEGALARPVAQLCRGYMVNAMFGFIEVWLEQPQPASLEEAKAVMETMCAAATNRFMQACVRE